MLSNISNTEYDELLSKTVVFIDLVDASAVNTVIECIVRCTPIIVNRHPAVEEYLGVEYPLYFTDDSSFTLTTKKINTAHVYLKNKDKSKLTFDYFTERFSVLLKQIDSGL